MPNSDDQARMKLLSCSCGTRRQGKSRRRVSMVAARAFTRSLRGAQDWSRLCLYGVWPRLRRWGWSGASLWIVGARRAGGGSWAGVPCARAVRVRGGASRVRRRGRGWPASAGPPAPPTPADFVRDPSCMLYAIGADRRIRVRAPHAATVCKRLSRQLTGSGSRWSLHPRRAHRILTPLCHLTDPRGLLELEVIDDAANTTPGARICANLRHAGWLDLQAP